MQDIPSIDSAVESAGLKFSIHTEVVPSGTARKINTFVTSSCGAAFSFNSRAEENFSAEAVRGQHEHIKEKISSRLPENLSSGNKNNIDYAAVYMKKEFRNGSGSGNEVFENIRKILILDDALR